jgi:hypothetical protein
MLCKNRAQMERAIKKRMKQAMADFKEQALDDMKEEMTEYYMSGTPIEYERTYEMENSPEVLPVIEDGDSVTTIARLNTDFTYNTGKEPTMLDVLNLANYGITNSSVGNLAPTVGEEHFWEKAKDKMENDFYKTMSKYSR